MPHIRWPSCTATTTTHTHHHIHPPPHTQSPPKHRNATITATQSPPKHRNATITATQSPPKHRNATITATQWKLQCLSICFCVHYSKCASAPRKTPPVQVAAGADHHECKWSICASWETPPAYMRGSSQLRWRSLLKTRGEWVCLVALGRRSHSHAPPSCKWPPTPFSLVSEDVELFSPLCVVVLHLLVPYKQNLQGLVHSNSDEPMPA